MLRALVSIFSDTQSPVAVMGEQFNNMLRLALENTLVAGEIYFGKAATPQERSKIYDQDVQINKLERTIRKQVATHLYMANDRQNTAYCLQLMSLVKDVERMGDYAKNLSEVVELHEEPLPDDVITAELKQIRQEVEAAFTVAAKIFTESDRERALSLIRAAEDISRRCDTLIQKNARSDYSAAITTSLVLGIRYYKRLNSHVRNVLTAVIMPLHKLDFYDESELDSEKS